MASATDVRGVLFEPRTRTSVTVVVFTLLFLSLVVIRLFIESVAILPGWLTYAYDLLFPCGILALLLPEIRRRRGLQFYGLGPWCLAFILVWAVSSLLNRDVHAVSATAFLVMHVEGILWFLILANLPWDQDSLRQAAAVVFFLGAMQLVLGAGQIPWAIATSNPDVVSGSFGQNSSQTAYFLGVFTFLLVGYYSIGKFAFRRTLFWLLWTVVIFYAAGFRALWISYPFTIVLAAYLGGRLSRGRLVGIVAVLIVSVALAVATVGQAVARFADVFQVDLLQLGKVRAVVNVGNLYRHNPAFALLGCGPGNFSSRAWSIFHRIGVWGAVDYSVFDNPNWGGGPSEGLAWYPPGYYSSLYTLPLYQRPTALFGSTTIDGPFTSYTALLGEVGIVGTVALFGAYGAILVRLLRIMKASRNEHAYAFAMAALGGFVLLFQMALFDNWLEVGRVTIVSWALAAAPMAYQAHRGREAVASAATTDD